MSTVQEDQKEVRTALDIDKGLSSWEVGFLESIAKWVIDDGNPLTSKQRSKLDQILEKHGR